MAYSASFEFMGSLADFLPWHQRGKVQQYLFESAPAVKDAIEALGIPHPEVAAIQVNGTPVNFASKLTPNALITVWPLGSVPSFNKKQLLQPPVPVPIRFVLDVHLGKLARLLRLLGFDTMYDNSYAEATVAQLADQENRVVLTRDVGLLKHKVIQWGYWLRSQHPVEQLREVVLRFQLEKHLNTFTRCMACNGNIIEVSKVTVQDQLPPKTKQYFNLFYQCTGCRKVYWKGSHYDHMQEFLQELNTDH